MMEIPESLPRVPLAHLPTPLEPLDRLSEALAGPRIWIKRDDCTGLATGGNKTRKLEFLLGAAEAQGADTVVTYGAVQSNHARQTAAACARRGLECHLLLARKVPWRDPAYERLGNVLLDHLFAARVRLVAPEAMSNASRTLLADLSAAGRKPYVIPVGGSNATGALGYVAAAAEIHRQCEQRSVPLSHLVHATSSAGTQAGLLAGFTLLERLGGGARHRVRVRGINVSEPEAEEEALVATIARLGDEALALCGHREPLDRAEIHVDSAWLGDGYGLPTRETLAAVRQVATLEGILLDPVYTGKAMGGLLGRIRSGELDGVDDVLFLHTGGAAALPAYGAALLAYPPGKKYCRVDTRRRDAPPSA